MRPFDAATAQWRKSSRSGQQGGCVEVAWQAAVVGVRDSKDPAGPHLEVTAAQWRGFVAAVAAGRFDR